MCDYCDCRSHRVVASLSAEHEQILRLLAVLDGAAAALDRKDVRAAADEIHRLLDAHTNVEERGIFEQLRACGVDRAYVARFDADHVRVHHLLAALDSDDWRHAATTIAAELSEHIAREETDLFPAAHQLLSPSQWEAVEAVQDRGVRASPPRSYGSSRPSQSGSYVQSGRLRQNESS